MTVMNHAWVARTVAVLLAMAMALTLTPTSAQAGHRPRSYCSPNGDYCTEAVKDDGVRLKIAGFAFRGRYKLCVTTPHEDRTCQEFRMTENDAGQYADSVRWARHFPSEGSGAYRVAWRKSGERLGPVLGFHIK